MSFPKISSGPDSHRGIGLLYVEERARHRWREVDHLGFETFVSPDGLHMNDWSYACMAKGLGLAIAEAAERPAMAATAMSYLGP